MKPTRSLRSKRQVDRIEGQIAVRGDEFADVATEPPGVDLIAPDLQGFEGSDDPVGVLGDEAGEEVDDPLAGRRVDPTEHPIIERGDHPTFEDPEVPRVGVGVEEAEPEDLPEEDLRAGDGHGGGVGPQPLETFQVVDADPADQLHRQDAGRAEVAEDLGDVRRGFAGELPSATLHRPTLGREVKLSLQGPFELAGEGDGSIRDQRRHPTFGELREVLEDVEVGLDDLVDPRSADLEGDHSASGECRAMDLRDRGGGERLGLDRPEDLRRRPAEFLGEDRLDLGERERLDVVAELRQLGRVGFGEEVGAGAEDLAELHEGRPEVLADHPEPPRAVLGRDLVAERRAFERADEAVEVERGDDVAIAVADQARQDLAVSGKVAEVAHGFAEQADAALGFGGRRRIGCRMTQLIAVRDPRQRRDPSTHRVRRVASGRHRRAFSLARNAPMRYSHSRNR